MPEIEAVKTGGKEKDLISFKVKRNIDGIRVTVKSEVLAKFFEGFKQASAEADGSKTDTTKVAKWGGLVIWKMAKFPQVENASFDQAGGTPLLNDFIANLAFLRATKLAEGVEFTIKGPYNKSQTENFYNASRRAIKDLFWEYLEDTEYDYILTGKTSV